MKKDKLREGNYNFITYQRRRWWNQGWLLSKKWDSFLPCWLHGC